MLVRSMSVAAGALSALNEISLSESEAARMLFPQLRRCEGPPRDEG